MPPRCTRIRRAEPHVLLLDAGDQYQGTIWFTVYKGTEVAASANALRYDAMVRSPARQAGEPRGGVSERERCPGEGAADAGEAVGGEPRTPALSDVERKRDSRQSSRWMLT